MTNNYQANNIKSLDYFEHIRKYPGMYIGSKDSKGLLHCVKEIISNSIDEYLNGAGNTITINFLPNNGIKIEDNGRGIPHGTHESGCSILQACFGIANTGGKFDNATGESGSNTSGGEHGTGGKAVNALSTKMIVKTMRDSLEETVEFSKGKFISYQKEKIDKSLTGTSVEFYPDKEIFETVNFDVKAIKEMVKEFSFLCQSLKFIVIDTDNKEEIFLSNNGLSDYMDYLNPKKDYIAPPIHFYEEEGKYQIEVAIGYNNSYSSIIRLYTNNIPQDKGTHLTGFKTAWTMSLNNFARENKLLKDKEENLSGSDYEEGMILILNFKMIDPVFKGQNKEELSSSEGRTYVQKLTSQALKNIFDTQAGNIKPIIIKALNARKAREAARKARETVRNQNEKKQKALKFDSKLADCYSKKRSQCEIYITEGDSASGNLKDARNNEFQAVLPVRGKILNTQKASLDKIQKNAEIMTMIQAFGLTIDPKNMKITYHPEDLRYGKIIIMSDADVDGAHIKNLFYTFIWNFCPELIKDGYIYAGVPPLYKITVGKKYKYLKNDEALEAFRKENVGKKYIVNRMKGLGEMDVDETEETLTDPENRIIRQITVEDVEATDKLFEDLMGQGVNARKAYIKEHSKEATYNAE